MGVLFNDPDVDLDDIYWYNTMANSFMESLHKNEGLIAFDGELNTYSCYVELHRKGALFLPNFIMDHRLWTRYPKWV